VTFFRQIFIASAKCLIFLGFENDPMILWITLLTACQPKAETPMNQGFEHNA
jgi:hypothetical protein